MSARPRPSVRAGIIGTGFMGAVHANAIRMSGGVVAAVASRSHEGALAALARLGGAEASESPDALIDRHDLDVIHICAPNWAHAELAAKVLASGKSVVCEKPLATTVEDAIALAVLAQEAGTVAAVPFVYRFYPAVREARARLHAGEAGHLWLLHGSYLQDWMSNAGTSNWRVDPLLGGDSRAFGDIGVHWCDLMEFVTGHRITRLTAKSSKAFDQRSGGGDFMPVRTEDGATLLFETDHGAVGSLVVSQVSPGRKNRLSFSFDGTEASFQFDQEQPGTLWIGDTGSTRSIAVGAETMLSAQGRKYALLPAGHPQGYQDAFNAFVTDVYDAVDGGSPDGLPTFFDGVRAAQLTAAVLQSTVTDEWVSVPEFVTISTMTERQR